jgi:hypothetical protein
MDLTTLVTACALAVDPKIMHALIWHPSGGEPWSFTVAGVHQPQVFRDLSDAVDAARDTYPADIAIRIGLTGLSATPRSVAAGMFAPCSNITIAARQIAQLAEPCKMSPHLNGDPINCAIAAYRGSWERPDNSFADAVRTSVANNDAPDFEMPARTDVNAAEVRSARRPAFHDTAMASPAAPDDRERARLSPLFPVKSRPSERPPIDDAGREWPAVEEQKSDIQSARPTPTQPPGWRSLRAEVSAADAAMTSALASLLTMPPIRTATRLAALLLLEPRSVRRRTSTPVTIPCAWAACETIAPGCSVSSTLARFWVGEAAAL